MGANDNGISAKGLKGLICILKDTHRGKAFSNKTPELWKSMNMYIQVVDISNQLFTQGP